MSESVHKKPKQKMIKKIPRYLLRRIRNLKDYLEWYYQKNSQESVYFYTFPKCASTLFSDYVLKNIVGLRHIDYAAQIYNGKIDNLVFKKTDFVYGPIRIFTIPMSPAYKNLPIPLEYTKLVEPTCHIDFIRNKNAIFLVRDPRYILVSNYYSICYSHGFSPIKEMREFQQQERAEIRSKSVDQYALESASALLNDFETLYKLSQACHKSVVLRACSKSLRCVIIKKDTKI
ncbi:MAG: hypothetical protein VSS75_000925 [Candidatus Parabeggiatoa sp.]|nr:hypothetical protein [Candidatus Parabeggiatoa sp.]